MNPEMSELETLKNEGESLSGFKTTTVLFTVILSLITVGIYVPYWFISRRKAMNQRPSEENVALGAPVVAIVLYGFLALTMVPVSFFVSGWLLAYYDYLQMVFIYLGVALILYVAFQMRSILNEGIQEKKLSGWCTFLFHIWYLQYKINRIKTDS